MGIMDLKCHGTGFGPTPHVSAVQYAKSTTYAECMYRPRTCLHVCFYVKEIGRVELVNTVPQACHGRFATNCYSNTACCTPNVETQGVFNWLVVTLV